MISYTADDVMVLARRHHNTKRTYLLVNPLQAKHLPVNPSRSLQMMRALGERITCECPKAKLVIGFAETATAIGAAAAECLGAGCRYIHTTREACAGVSNWICFKEEHSHAVDQKLCADDLARAIEDTPQVVFVDDEISTGKTLLNIIDRMRETFPAMRDKPVIAASIINRLSPENEARFREAGVKSVSLVKMPCEDLTGVAEQFEIEPAEPVSAQADAFTCDVLYTPDPLPDPRLGVDASDYAYRCAKMADAILEAVMEKLRPKADVLVLGTEECMYPALILAKALEDSGIAASVRCHATTRSPIGICADPAYPIRAGFRLHSFYEAARETYIYDPARYDAVIVLTDTPAEDGQARADLTKVFKDLGCREILFVEGGRHV